MSAQLMEIALDYAKKNWPVLPLHTPSKGACSCGLKCSSPGKHPRIHGGVHAASTDPQLIKRWWQSWPTANIGIATGAASNLVVIDLDERHGGIDSWRSWESEFSAKTSLIAKTGGGFHLFFDAIGSSLKCRAGILPGVDVRADGGFVVAPGSIHHTGVPYAWVCPEKVPSPLPLSLLKLLESKEPQSEQKKSHNISPGHRNDFLTRIAGLLRREAYEPKLINEALLAVNQVVCNPPLAQEEVQILSQGITRYAPKWREITNPVNDNIDVPELDLNALPHVMREWVSDAADRMQVPPEFFAAPCLVAFASVVGRQVGIFPKQEDSWYVIPNLWGAIIARPGFFKSPAILEATSFVRTLADKASAQYEADFLRFDINIDCIKAQIDGLKEAIKRAARDGKSECEINDIHQRIQELRIGLEAQNCVQKRYIVNDSTVEKLGVILKENPNGVLLLRDELAGWGASLNRREGDREFYLESWNGTGSFTVDRIGRGTLHIPNLCISIFGGIQPSKLDSLSAPYGSGSDGLLQRFQMLVFPNMPKNWVHVDRKPREAGYQALVDIFVKATTLSSLYPESINGLRFSKEAQEIFNDWRKTLEPKVRSGEIESEDFEAHLSKYRSLVPSLSLLFEAMQALSERREFAEVSSGSIEMAIAWANYLELHAKKVYQEKLSLPQKAANTLAQKIRNGAIKDGDSFRSIYRHHWTSLDTPEKLEKAVERLEECGWALTETVNNNAGKISIIRLNPKLNDFLSPEERNAIED